MGFLISIWRRFFGGYDSKYDWLESRGVQFILLFALVFFWEWLRKGYTWYISLIIAGLVYLFFCRGHWYYFQCGTESDEYIDEQLASGRKPALNWLVSKVNSWLGFEERTCQYCFIGMLLRYGLYSIPVAIFVGWQFFIVGCIIPFIYNACFWIELPDCKLAKTPTNWAELFAGLFVGWGLL